MISSHRRFAFGLLVSLAWACPAPGSAAPSVGMPARIDQIVLPGTELEARPIEDRRAKVVVRVVDVYPHGTAFRYNLLYYGLEPGDYDLRDALRRKDGGSTADLPPIPVKVVAILPPGQIEPHPLTPTPTAFPGLYRPLMFLAAAAWVAGLLAILLVGRKRRRVEDDRPGAVAPSLADRLRPLVESAMAGTLAEGQHAELERMLIDHWRRRLGLEALPPAAAIAAIRSDPTAGALLNRLEAWLHMPPGSAGPVDVAALLAPYRNIPDGEAR
ncbi:hypothetical protein TA3x_002948 [Tundrisphaera sp. TA3]|uniref:hypothetical protein n=1 Tax=Tundrisphaera sp. TA3 TaxID=3435775 RepID=UPI003EBA6DB3